MICIFNGRAGEDRGVGKATTKNNSLIDYVIGSPYILSKVKNFKVNPFDPLFSDCHCMVEWQINSNKTVYDAKIIERSPDPIDLTHFLDPNKSEEFLNNLDRYKITYMIDNFDNLSTNQITNNIKHIMIDSENSSLPKFRPMLNNARDKL